jgi:hypothetical protein
MLHHGRPSVAAAMVAVAERLVAVAEAVATAAVKAAARRHRYKQRRQQTHKSCDWRSGGEHTIGEMRHP